MTSETPPPFAPLPVRARDTLEIFDTSAKLYKRYFWVLLGWSALTELGSLLSNLAMLLSPNNQGAGVVAWFVTLGLKPLLVGAIACCIAAAVRGQPLSFWQCWNFSRPRYGATLGQIVLVWILGGLALVALIAIATLVGALAAFVVSQTALIVQILVSALLGLVAIVAFGVLGSFIFAWIYMTPLVVCLEDDRRGGAAQTRAWELLKQQWRRVTALVSIVSLAILAGLAIVLGFSALFLGASKLPEMMTGTFWESGQYLLHRPTGTCGLPFSFVEHLHRHFA